MTAYARVENGVVAEVVEIDPGTPMLRQRYPAALLPSFTPIPSGMADRVEPGWTWDGNAFAPPPDAGAAPPPVPREVTNFQARAVMMARPDPSGQRVSLFEAVDAALRAEGGQAWQAWEYANTLTRDGVLVAAMAGRLGLSPDQLDALFTAAARVEA